MNLPKCARCGTLQSSAANGGICDACRSAEATAATCADNGQTELLSSTAARSLASPAPSGTRPLFQLKDYEVLGEIARGGMGIVFKARQVHLNRMVAVKVIRSGQIAGATEIQRFFIEAKAAATLQHPNIVAIHEIGEEAGEHFFSMELIEGQSLGDFVRDHALAPREAALLVKTIAEAIHYAHQRGILHRDLKPSNVLVDQNHQPHITDFGLAKLMEDKSEVTASGAVMGSPSYMPPEQAEGRTNEVTVRSDIYSLGAMLYHLLTGRPPFAADSLLATLKLVVESDPVAPRQINAKIPRDLEIICLKCLEKSPAKRFGTAQEVADELRRFLTYQPIHSRSLGPVARTWRWCRRKPAVATALLIFICGFIGVYWQWQRAEALAINEASLRHGAEQASVEALLAQARVMRSSGLAGQRYHSLAALEKAARLQPLPEIRDEIAACLPLVDLRLKRQWQAPPAATSAVAFNPQLSLFASADGRQGIRICKCGGDESLTTLPSPPGVTMLQFSPNGKLLAAASGHGFAVWDIATRQRLLQKTNLTAPVVVDISPDSTRVCAGDASGAILIDDLSSGRPELSFGIGRACGAVRFGPGGTRLAVSSHESLNLFVFNALTGEEIGRMPHPAVLNDVAWNAAGTLLATACADNQIYIWDKSGIERTLLRGHTAPARRIAFTRTGSFLASLGEDKTLRIWEAATGHPLVRWEGVSGPVLQFDLKDRTLACLAGDSASEQMQLLEVVWPEEVRSFGDRPSEPGIFGAGALAEGGRLLIVPVEEGLHLWDSATGVQLAPIRIGRVQGVTVAEAGDDLVVKGFYGVHRLPLAHLRLRGDLVLLGPPLFLDCPPGDGGMALAGPDELAVCEGNNVTLLSLKSGAVAQKLTAPNDVEIVAASRDGKWIAAGSRERGGVTVWNRASGTSTNLLLAEPALMSFSPDSQWLVTSSESRCLFWRVGEWEAERTLSRRGHGTRPAPIAFSPDGMVLAWASADNVVSLVSTVTGDHFLSLPSPGQATVLSLQFTPSGGGLLIAAEGWPLRLWDLGSVRQKILQCGLAVDSPRKLPPAWTEAGQQLPPVLADVSRIDHTPNAREDLQRCQSQARSHPDDFNTWRQVASINSSFYRLAPAVEAYQQALRLDPGQTACRLEDGYALLMLQRFPEAADQYQQVLAQDPRNALACQELAYLYLHGLTTNRDVAAGLRYAERAFQINPKDPASLFWLGVARYRSGKFKEALELIEQALAVNPSTQIYLFYQSMCLAKLGRTEEATHALNNALDRLQAHPDSLVEHQGYFESFITEARAVCAPTKDHE